MCAVPCRFGLPDLGIGVGLLSRHVEEVLAAEPEIDWFEAITESYLAPRTSGSSDESVCTESVGACWYHEPSS